MVGNREEYSATTLIDMFAKTREMTEFGTTATALGEPSQCILALIEGAVDLINWSSCMMFMLPRHVA